MLKNLGTWKEKPPLHSTERKGTLYKEFPSKDRYTEPGVCAAICPESRLSLVNAKAKSDSGSDLNF